MYYSVLRLPNGTELKGGEAGAHCALLRDCGPIFNPCAHAHTFQLLTPN